MAAEQHDERAVLSPLAMAAAHLERVWVAQQRIADRSDPGSDAATVAAWAEETLEWMIEMSEWVAETWGEVASTMERAAGIDAPAANGSVTPTAEDLLAPTSFLDVPAANGYLDLTAEDRPGPTSLPDVPAANGSVAPTAEDLLAPTSFLDALNAEDEHRTHHAV